MKVTSTLNNLFGRFIGRRVVKKPNGKFPFSIVETKNTNIGWDSKGPVGMVEEFAWNKITGWVSAKPEDFPIKITLNINGYPVHNTWANVSSAHNTWGEIWSFYIVPRGIWKYCKRKDRVTVQIGQHILPIYNKGVYKRPGQNGTETLGKLKKLLASGYIFNNLGDLQLSKKLDDEWQAGMMGMYDRIVEILEDKYSITPFLIYGSLLGQVREGGFIGHDGDFDIAYLSEHTRGHDAALELKDIALTLMDAGFDIDQHATAIHIHSKENHKLKVDLFHIYFNEGRSLSFPYGVAGTCQFLRKDWTGITGAVLAGYSVTVPANAEKLVEYMYGSTWRTPIAGFNWDHARTKRDKSGEVVKSLRDEVNQLNATVNKK